MRATAAAALLLGAAAVAVGCGGSTSSAPSGPETVELAPAAPKSRVTAVDQAHAFQDLLVRVIRNVAPAVVQLETKSGLGSGIVYDGKGDIVTNAHVVGDAKKLTVTLANGDRHPATVVGTFPPNDLAVVHIEGATPRPARFGHSATLAVGDVVLAIGNPLGLRSSVTDSEVIGIPTLAALDPEFGQTPAPGIGFAIPSDTVKLIADQLIKTGKVTQSGRAYLGVRVASPLNGGILVASVEPGGPADRAGMKPGDRIVVLNKTPVANTDELATVLAEITPPAKVPVAVVRNGKKLILDVEVGQLKSTG
jgi:putative serine protease PepD